MENLKKRTKEQNRRYRLHQKIKKLFVCYAKKKTVIVPFDWDLQNVFVLELRDRFNYNIQFSIISADSNKENEDINTEEKIPFKPLPHV